MTLQNILQAFEHGLDVVEVVLDEKARKSMAGLLKPEFSDGLLIEKFKALLPKEETAQYYVKINKDAGVLDNSTMSLLFVKHLNKLRNLIFSGEAWHFMRTQRKAYKEYIRQLTLVKKKCANAGMN